APLAPAARRTNTAMAGQRQRTKVKDAPPVRQRQSDQKGRISPAPALLLCQGWGRFEGVEDDADEESFEAADRFASALAFGTFAFEVRAGGRVVARLRDRDSVERGVELAVATAVEPMPLYAS